MRTDKRESTLNNGNPIRQGTGRPKDSVNKYRKEMLRIGEENCLSLYKTYLEMATSDPDKEIRRKCHEFLLEKVMPRLPYKTYVDIPLLSMGTIENIKENEDTICKHISNGSLSLEEGKELFAITDQARKSWECTEGVRLHDEMQKMWEEAKSRK